MVCPLQWKEECYFSFWAAIFGHPWGLLRCRYGDMILCVAKIDCTPVEAWQLKGYNNASPALVCCYLGQWPPVHFSASNVNVRPIHYPEWGVEASFGESCHIDKTNLGIYKQKRQVLSEKVWNNKERTVEICQLDSCCLRYERRQQRWQSDLQKTFNASANLKADSYINLLKYSYPLTLCIVYHNATTTWPES